MLEVRDAMAAAGSGRSYISSKIEYGLQPCCRRRISKHETFWARHVADPNERAIRANAVVAAAIEYETGPIL